ncbi:hypothetical protein AMTR_s00185p00025910 [Amborella trichopoda]|uniref:Uncharacterized protein n=1 Tax=Amborella trichopoda TaxID=13333 RepID=U5CWW6_AMBTC|nr:hypothetical protein AMTR_s00185p00025910 [Amborella trichopoda]
MTEPIGMLIWLLKKVEESLAVTPSDGWWIDSGLTRHISTSKEHVVEFREKKVGDWKLYMGNSSWVHILGEAIMKLPLPSEVLLPLMMSSMPATSGVTSFPCLR